MLFFRSRPFRMIAGGLASLFYPGVGHILARRWSFGAALLGISLACSLLVAAVTSLAAPSPAVAGFVVAMFGFALALGLYAAISSMRLLARQKDDIRPSWLRSAWLATLVAVAATAAFGEAFPRTWRSFSTPATSNMPTLLIGDLFIADMRSFTPKIGDMIVFKLPREPETIYVKRIVAGPGDRVRMAAGRLVINEAVVPREPIASRRIETLSGEMKEAPTYREMLPGEVAHTIIEAQGDHGYLDNTAEFLVPADSWFVLGDNRDNSNDSRVSPDKGGVGFVPTRNIIGKPATIYMSRDLSRILTAIR